MTKRKFSDFTEAEFVAWVFKIKKADFKTEAEHDEAIYQFGELTEHPERWDLIFHPAPDADNSAQGIVNTVKEWRAANGKSGFKSF
nr:bacteriocin immunity protein [uncultured Enterobacter sp.]